MYALGLIENSPNRHPSRAKLDSDEFNEDNSEREHIAVPENAAIPPSPTLLSLDGRVPTLVSALIKCLARGTFFE